MEFEFIDLYMKLNYTTAAVLLLYLFSPPSPKILNTQIYTAQKTSKPKAFGKILHILIQM